MQEMAQLDKAGAEGELATQAHDKHDQDLSGKKVVNDFKHDFEPLIVIGFKRAHVLAIHRKLAREMTELAG